jgi:DNA-binding transcriptional ArsR family regulator
LIKSVEKAIAILKTFTIERPELSVTELSQELTLHKSTVSRLLSTLEEGNLVEQNPETGKYRLGVALIGLGALVIAHTDVREDRTLPPPSTGQRGLGDSEPGGGFLADDHTLDNWRWAQWRPELIDRSRYDNWVEKGCQDMTARASERARQILAEHQVPSLPEAAEVVITEVLEGRQM